MSSPLSLTYTDVNEAYYELQYTKHHYVREEMTRNGAALVFQEPVLLTHTSPYRRVLFDPIRNANPFFHYMEAIWMLAGANSVPFLAKFAQNIKQYSDNGTTFHAAYGHRWKHHFGADQIEQIIYMLKKDSHTRRAVLGMWDPEVDLESFSKDLPCNTHVYFKVQENYLHMTICNRSNDLVWGMLGANFVHMSILQEYIANAVDLEIGNMYQFTNNLHVYLGWEDKWERGGWDDWYTQRPTLQAWRFGPRNFDQDEAIRFVEEGIHSNRPYQCRILRDNAVPMYDAWEIYKQDDLHKAIHVASRIYDDDWRKGCVDWLVRVKDDRENKR
jgi:thymidylate synthase